jgi:hypothetical protein
MSTAQNYPDLEEGEIKVIDADNYVMADKYFEC